MEHLTGSLTDASYKTTKADVNTTAHEVTLYASRLSGADQSIRIRID